MKIVIDGNVHNPRKEPILVVLDTGDLMTILELTPRPPESPAPFFQCPDNLDESEALTLEKAWIEVVRKDAEDEYLDGKLPFTIRMGSPVKREKVMNKLTATEGIDIVDVKWTSEDSSIIVHCAPEKKIVLEDLVCDFGVELIEGGAADRPIMHADGVIVSPPKHVVSSGTVVEFRKLDQREWLDEKLGGVVESFRKSDVMAAFLDEILLQGMTCEHCGHKGLVRREEAVRLGIGCICHETVVGKDECPIHGRPAQAHHSFMQLMGESNLICACGEHRNAPIHHRPEAAVGLKVVKLRFRKKMRDGEFFIDWEWFHEREGKLIVLFAKDKSRHDAVIVRVDATSAEWMEVILAIPAQMPLDESCRDLGIQYAMGRHPDLKEGDKDDGPQGGTPEGEQTE